jgi:hypothetical protein
MNKCEKCGVNIRRNKSGFHNGSVHHRLPRRLGGLDTVSNCTFICLTCHREIHRDEDAAALQGWIVWADPDVTPVLRQGKGKAPGWVLLVPDGSLEYLTYREGRFLCGFANWLEGVSQAS